MAKKGKQSKEKAYKYLSKYKIEKYKGSSKEELVTALKGVHNDLKAEKANKKSSQALKDARADIKEFDESWKDNAELIKAKEAYDAIKDQRNEERKELQEAKKLLEDDFKEAIDSFSEEREFILNELSKR